MGDDEFAMEGLECGGDQENSNSANENSEDSIMDFGYDSQNLRNCMSMSR